MSITKADAKKCRSAWNHPGLQATYTVSMQARAPALCPGKAHQQNPQSRECASDNNQKFNNEIIQGMKMVTAVQHLNRTLGIDLTRPAGVQSTGDLMPGYIHNGDSDLKACAPYRYLEAIYDAVVGVNEAQGTAFDSDHGQPGKIGIPELIKLFNISSQMSSRKDVTEGQKTFLNNIARASEKYLHLLAGDISILKKDMDSLGNRHTLMRGKREHLYEMTNSMTQNELALFKNKTKMIINAVENPGSEYLYCKKRYAKIEMGHGTFGKTRIARDIDSDTFVAVKKIHPKLDISLEGGFFMKKSKMSNYYLLDRESKRRLDEIKEYVISPLDECNHESRHSGLANELNQFVPSSEKELLKKIHNTKEIADVLHQLDSEQRDLFVQKMREATFSGTDRADRTRYGFSELGISTIDDLIDHFNVLRTYFESRKNTGLSDNAKDLLAHYAEKRNALPDTGFSDGEVKNLCQALGEQAFESKSFTLKDPVYNQRFLNTLGKKMLVALSQLHQCGITHQDIKPDNIVICQDDQGLIKVKLIDIDMIQKMSGEREQPRSGCRMYMPPEALIAEKDGSISYTGEKGDAYAMGLTLRKILGFSFHEIVGLNQRQKAEVNHARLPVGSTAGAATEVATGLENSLRQLQVSGDFDVKKQLHIKAISRAAPEALSLKDMADLMLKEHPGKRLSPKSVLTDYSFFNEERNLLDETEFATHVQAICQFAALINSDQISAINYRKVADKNGLAVVRQSAMQQLILGRGQQLTGDDFGSLSKREIGRVKRAEMAIQAQAGLRRLGRSFKSFLSPKTSDADKKNSYGNR